MAGPVETHGLAELQRELRKLDASWPRELRKGNKAVAEGLLPKAAQELRSHGNRVLDKAAESLVARAEQRRAKIAVGSARVPWGWGAEFGAKQFAQFETWRGNQHVTEGSNGPGYGIYPAIRDNEQLIVDAMGDMIDRLTSAAFPD